MAFTNLVRTLLGQSAIGNELRVSNDIRGRQFREDHLKKYSDQFNYWRRQVKPLIDEIDIEAHLALKDIADYTDSYSTLSKSNEMYTRHIFYKILYYFFNAYNYELIEKQELYRISRWCEDINNIIHIQTDYQENPIIEHQELEKFLTVFFERLTEQQEQLYQIAIKRSQQIFKLLEENTQFFKQGIEQLKNLLEDNQVEGGKIEENPVLFNEYHKLLRKLEFFVYSEQIKNLISYLMPDHRLSQVILLCLYLILLAQHDSWGREMPI
ncbi:hypothetical protein [Chroococcus sp. FPU101]|uniref:hypothetical protein n=1 Tax=Chroococcus sp. FPU101 TaxID=1974212 RepID=UPI001A907555|nr:hypothetical protein [Chroococcus sp. FPU101]